jgi:IS5 family transposase
VILDHHTVEGIPPDAPMLAPAIERTIARAGRAPRGVTADRGYHVAVDEDALNAARSCC